MVDFRLEAKPLSDILVARGLASKKKGRKFIGGKPSFFILKML